MSVYKDKRSGRWRYRKVVQLSDGSKERISGTPSINLKEYAERAGIKKHVTPHVLLPDAGDFLIASH